MDLSLPHLTELVGLVEICAQPASTSPGRLKAYCYRGVSGVKKLQMWCHALPMPRAEGWICSCFCYYCWKLEASPKRDGTAGHAAFAT